MITALWIVVMGMGMVFAVLGLLLGAMILVERWTR